MPGPSKLGDEELSLCDGVGALVGIQFLDEERAVSVSSRSLHGIVVRMTRTSSPRRSSTPTARACGGRGLGTFTTRKPGRAKLPPASPW